MSWTSATEYSFFIETLGCPKNRADSRQMRTQLLTAGFRESANAADADFLLINTCVFVQEAQEETIAEIFQHSLDKQQKKKDSKIILVGCFVQKYAEEIKKDIPEVDLALGVGRYHEIAQILSQHYRISLAQHSAAVWQHCNQEIFPYGYIRLAKGCSRSCAFCVIPFVRGRHESFSHEDIVRQFKEETNFTREIPLREIVLVSQDTVSQNLDELRRTLDFFSEQENIEWIRLHYLFPDKRVFDFLKLYQEYPRLVSYLDIPFQHVSPAVLKKMNRPADVTLFKEILHSAKQIRPNMEVRTSFILGFPNESENDYNMLEKFLQDNTAKFSLEKLSLFRYSHESETPAFVHLQDDIEESIKIDRMNKLRNLHLQLRSEGRQEKIDTTERLLIDSLTDEEIVARREFDSPEIDEVVFIPNPAGNLAQGEKSGKEKKFSAGDFIKAKLTMPMEYDWIGEYIE